MKNIVLYVCTLTIDSALVAGCNKEESKNYCSQEFVNDYNRVNNMSIAWEAVKVSTSAPESDLEEYHQALAQSCEKLNKQGDGACLARRLATGSEESVSKADLKAKCSADLEAAKTELKARDNASKTSQSSKPDSQTDDSAAVKDSTSGEMK